MARLIDADALMDYCNNQKDKTIDANDIARFPTAVCWVSAIDRLPDKNEEVVICYEWTGLFSGSKYREVIVDTIADLGPECFVIAWMPLPKPPEEDATSGNH